MLSRDPKKFEELETLESISKIKKFFHPEDFPKGPTGRFISIILLRKSESELVLRTDEGITKELVRLGFKDHEVKSRVVFSKRKVTAVERRSGREFLRLHGLLTDCAINAAMCGQCPDCLLYGFAAAEKGSKSKGSLKSRILTENAYSILPASEITDERTFNALSELETMTDVGEEGKLKMRESISSPEYIKPEAHFVDIETFRDVRLAEFVYGIGNILRTSRYGAISSRMGKVKNEIVAIVAADAEPFSALQLVKSLWDELEPEKRRHPLDDGVVREKLEEVVRKLFSEVPADKVLIINPKNRDSNTPSNSPLQEFLEAVKAIYEAPEETGFIEALKGLKKIETLEKR